MGAGDAWFAQQFIRSVPTLGRFVCWDVNYSREQLADLQTTLPGSLHLTSTRPEGRFDVMLLLDVLEHVPDDTTFLGSLVRDSLAPGGTVIISVPAYQKLFSSHDRFLRHYRRYSPAQCRSVMASAGLQPVAQGGLFHTLLPVRVTQVALEKLRRRAEADATGTGQWNRGGITTRAVTSVLEAEAMGSFLLGVKQRTLPGLSYWAVAHQVR